tara:strand:- start:86 stop:715 length:630 start_codon:yes stop_codon:yes gene_type:complete
MDINPDTLDSAECYRLLVGIVVPRPIAWVTSMDAQGRINAAPFSCYTFVCKAPPMIAIVVGHREHRLKDTSRNIHEGSDFVVNAVTENIAKSMHETSADYPPDISEVEAIGLELVPSRVIKTPGIAVSPIHMECRLHRIEVFGRENEELIVGEVVHFNVADALISDKRIKINEYHPLARLGGPNYTKLGERMQMTFSSEFGGQLNKRST